MKKSLAEEVIIPRQEGSNSNIIKIMEKKKPKTKIQPVYKICKRKLTRSATGIENKGAVWVFLSQWGQNPAVGT